MARCNATKSAGPHNLLKSPRVCQVRLPRGVVRHHSRHPRCGERGQHQRVDHAVRHATPWVLAAVTSATSAGPHGRTAASLWTAESTPGERKACATDYTTTKKRFQHAEPRAVHRLPRLSSATAGET